MMSWDKEGRMFGIGNSGFYQTCLFELMRIET